MKKGKYGNFLTVVLIILIVAIIGLIGYFGYTIIKGKDSNATAAKAIEEFDSNLDTDENTNDDEQYSMEGAANTNSNNRK